VANTVIVGNCDSVICGLAAQNEAQLSTICKRTWEYFRIFMKLRAAAVSILAFGLLHANSCMLLASLNADIVRRVIFKILAFSLSLSCYTQFQVLHVMCFLGSSFCYL